MPASPLERLGELTDPRDRRGRQYPLVTLHGLCLAAILAGHSTLAAIRDPDADHLDRIIGEWLADRHPGGWGHLALVMLHAPPSISA